jgi:hypothetical protein
VELTVHGCDHSWVTVSHQEHAEPTTIEVRRAVGIEDPAACGSDLDRHCRQSRQARHGRVDVCVVPFRHERSISVSRTAFAAPHSPIGIGHLRRPPPQWDSSSGRLHGPNSAGSFVVLRADRASAAYPNRPGFPGCLETASRGRDRQQHLEQADDFASHGGRQFRQEHRSYQPVEHLRCDEPGRVRDCPSSVPTVTHVVTASSKRNARSPAVSQNSL